MADLREIWERTRTRAADAWDTFRAQSGYFQLKVLIVALNVAVLVGTVVIFLPTPPLFIVGVRTTTVVLSERRVVDVTSLDYGDAENLKIVIHGADEDSGKAGSWRTKLKKLPQGIERSIPQKRFKDKRGLYAPPALRIDRIEIYNSGGDRISTHHMGALP